MDDPNTNGRIYLLRSRTTGKLYVGQTTQTLSKRWRQHCKAALRPSRTQPISNAIRKYGADDFEMTLLVECPTQEELDAEECQWAHELRTFAPAGYNLRAGNGPGSTAPEVRERLSALMTDERREHLRQLWSGRRLSDEAYANARATRLARMPQVTLLSPDGEAVVIHDMAAHAQAHQLEAGLMWKVAYDERLQHQGWRLMPEQAIAGEAIALGGHRYCCPVCKREWERRGGQHKANQHATLCLRLAAARAYSLQRGYISQEKHDQQLAALGVYRKQVRVRPRTKASIRSLTLSHQDGRVVHHVGFARDFAEQHGLSRSKFSSLLNGHIDQLKGWRLVEIVKEELPTP